jgi:hypothetical protein
VDVVPGTACTLCRVQDLDVGAAVHPHSLGLMARQEELVAWRGLQDRDLSHAATALLYSAGLIQRDMRQIVLLGCTVDI